MCSLCSFSFVLVEFIGMRKKKISIPHYSPPEPTIGITGESEENKKVKMSAKLTPVRLCVAGDFVCFIDAKICCHDYYSYLKLTLRTQSIKVEATDIPGRFKVLHNMCLRHCLISLDRYLSVSCLFYLSGCSWNARPGDSTTKIETGRQNWDRYPTRKVDHRYTRRHQAGQTFYYNAHQKAYWPGE